MENACTGHSLQEWFYKNFQIKINFGGTILGGLGPLAPYSDASDHVWTSLDKFGQVWSI